MELKTSKDKTSSHYFKVRKKARNTKLQFDLKNFLAPKNAE